MASWSERNGMPLSASYGYVCHAEYPDRGVTELAKLADKRMYAAKARYYQANGADRRIVSDRLCRGAARAAADVASARRRSRSIVRIALWRRIPVR